MSFFRAREGSALLLVLFIISFLAVVSKNLLWSAGVYHHLGINLEAYKKAYYAAEAGIAYGRYLVLDYFQGMPEQTLDGRPYTAGESYGEEILLDNGSSFIISFVHKDNKNKIEIKVEGKWKDSRESISEEITVAESN